MKSLNINISGTYKTIMWVSGICTCGVGAYFMWLSSRSWPKVIDEEGMTLQNGKRVLWKEMTDRRSVTVVDSYTGRRITGRLELIFGKTTVRIVPQSIVEGSAAIDFITEIIGEEVESG